MNQSDLSLFLARLLEQLQAAFGEKLLYMGLQGSYRRGEATATSDVDIMLVLETVGVEELSAYKRILARLREELAIEAPFCGFIAGRAEMAAWNGLEVTQLLMETRDLYGELEAFLPPCSREDVIDHVKLGAGNILHALCHHYLYSKRPIDGAWLLELYKPAFYVLQHAQYLRTGEFVLGKRALLPKLVGTEREVLLTLLALIGGEEVDADKAYALLLKWAQQTIVFAF